MSSISLPCFAGGRSIINWNMCCQRTGGDNDSSSWRIVRRRPDYPDVYLVGTATITMTPRKDTRSWTWVDDDIPADGTYTYQLQVQRLDGGGQIFEMVLLGQHFKR